MSITQLFLQRKELPRLDLVAIVSHVTGASKEEILADPGRELASSELEEIVEYIDARSKGKPLAYITGEREFYSEPFYVDERVLIPRPETELLVEEAIAFMQQRKGPTRVLDMGTGSGIIGIMLAKNGAASVTCADKSMEALAVATRNAHALALADRIAFLSSDLCASLKEETAFDLICANLPYISETDWMNLMTDVKEFEPKIALVGGPSGNELYEAFIPQLRGRLSSDGMVICEIDGPEQACVVCAIMRESGLQAAVKKDLSGRERVVSASWINS